LSNPSEFLPDVYPKDKPDRPEPIDYDYEQDECPSCKFSLLNHTSKQIVNCALHEIQIIRGVTK